MKVGVLRISTEALSVKVEPEPRLGGPPSGARTLKIVRSMVEENPTRSALSTFSS
jgi:hypothetical protein